MVNKGSEIVIATMRYNDAPAAIEWLCQAFGFERHMVVEGERNTIAHAQLTLGTGMIMLGSAGSGDHDDFVKPPERRREHPQHVRRR